VIVNDLCGQSKNYDVNFCYKNNVLIHRGIATVKQAISADYRKVIASGERLFEIRNRDRAYPHQCKLNFHSISYREAPCYPLYYELQKR
jgi:hypothetical protein